MRLRGERIIYDLQISPEDALRLVNSQSYTADQRFSQANASAPKGHPAPYYYPNHPSSIQPSFSSGYSEQSPYSPAYPGQSFYSSAYTGQSAYRRNPPVAPFTRERPISMVDSWNQGYRASWRNEADSAAPSSLCPSCPRPSFVDNAAYYANGDANVNTSDSCFLNKLVNGVPTHDSSSCLLAEVAQ